MPLFRMKSRTLPSTIAAMAAVLCAWSTLAAAAPGAASWQVVGQQGLMHFVIVPAAQATDRAAYAKQIETMCQSSETCFVNFYTNSSGAAVGLPLPDAIDKEATAVYRRSAKQGTDGFQWSCRLKTTDTNCF